ncbi:L,D-transpeptidase family protein [Desulfallas thermosapovorans]|uniref:Copper amine oxidase-like protein n=1 Tax=Desulfallas thermosapovorans DSM 6562 TaxID=1121431 RepID=A0A5S4ZW12_9FIRM|nr:L,D-transpeptidase family protein [Desulfallas thermosapovorans]TYO97187.1 copper amine oxidase-like protein [Desulfallas thermosapovorans DSM 6562]
MVKRLLVLLVAFSFCLVHASTAFAAATIIIDKSTNKLHYYQDEVLLKTFPVATGKSPSLTPEGNFTVVIKLVNPYYARGGIAGGSPQNPLGYRWLGLSVGGGGIYGIHGTNNPASIGTYASAGCIRMYNQDVNWLFDHTPLGTPVQIIRSGATRVPTPPKPKPLPVTVALGGKNIDIKVPVGTSPDGSPLLPLRPIFEALDYAIGWDDASHTIHITKGNEYINVACTSGRVTTRQSVFVCPELKLAQGAAHAPISFWQRVLPKTQINWDAGQRRVTFNEKTIMEKPFPGTSAPGEAVLQTP